MAHRLSRNKTLIGILLAIATLSIAAPFHAQTFMRVCESPSDSCKAPDASPTLTWTFNGTTGFIDSIAGSRLTIERLDDQAILVRRTDTTGLSALYSGHLRGAAFVGDVAYTWPDHPGYPRQGSFAAQSLDQPAASQNTVGPDSSSNQSGLPHELLVCEDGVCNGAWILDGLKGTATWFLRNPARATLSVLHFSPDDVRIRRIDTTDAISAIYAGRMKGDHYEGTIVWSSPGHAGDRTGHWSAAAPKLTCGPGASLDADTAMQFGQNALMFGRIPEANACYIIAATAGDARAQTAVGLTYYQGRDTIPQDYAKALFWLRKAADQGVYNAQRTVAEMYKAGQGTKPDPALAEIYTARADEQKHDFERQQELEERAKDRSAQVLSSFVLGASFGLFF